MAQLNAQIAAQTAKVEELLATVRKILVIAGSDGIDMEEIAQKISQTTDEAVRRALQKLEGLDVASLTNSVERLQDLIAQILLELEVQNIYPGHKYWLIEDFRVPDQIDLFKCNVNSVVAGDDSLDCETLSGILPGSHYTLTDGINSEMVCVKSMSDANGIRRIMLTTPVKKTYRVTSCHLLRASAQIENGRAVGPAGIKSFSWTPGIVWKGQGAETETLVTLKTDIANEGIFTCTENIAFSSDGFLTLGGR